MSSSKLPPLHFLHAVEAAARLGSFRLAAAELHLTPSAVSQQIRAVEAALGARVFVRRGRAVMLTPEGKIYCDEVRRTLLELLDAGRRLAAHSNAHVLRLSTVDFIAHEFLIPRLPAFQEQFPGVELRIETSMKVIELHSSEMDAALRVRGKAGPGLTCIPIGDVFATPVANVETAQRLHGASDLCRETLIEMRGSTEGSWADLLRAEGHEDGGARILSFESYFETLTAAEQGLGVAFGLFPMTTEWVLTQRLAVPFARRVPVEGGVYLLFRARHPRHALLTRVADWLCQEYTALPPLPEGRIVSRAEVSRGESARRR
jgi:LysR family glycine cleavage system transcriptional activator